MKRAGALLSTDENGNAKVRLGWGSGMLGHWGVEIGMKDMKIPPSDFSMYGEIILPVEPGLYIWLSEYVLFTTSCLLANPRTVSSFTPGSLCPGARRFYFSRRCQTTGCRRRNFVPIQLSYFSPGCFVSFCLESRLSILYQLVSER